MRACGDEECTRKDLSGKLGGPGVPEIMEANSSNLNMIRE